MSNADPWLERYERDHTHTINRVLHWMCVPVIVVGIVGLLWSVPVPSVLRDASPVLNWGTFFLMAAVVYYFILSITLAIGMLPFVVLIAAAVSWLDRLDTPLWLISATVFAVAGAGQLIGHAFERRSVSLFSDLNFVMIGPLWIIASIYQRLRIPY
jgi:uncharacterized membrane protein YGL010W